MNEIGESLVERLYASLREAFDGRAAIMEFDFGLSREYAEALAPVGPNSAPPIRCVRLLAMKATAQKQAPYMKGINSGSDHLFPLISTQGVFPCLKLKRKSKSIPLSPSMRVSAHLCPVALS